jgi:uncharacterized protein DUF547
VNISGPNLVRLTSLFKACFVFTASLMTTSLCHAEPPEAWMHWQPANAKSTHKVDHHAWQLFLDAYVSTHQDGINRVHYTRARNDNAQRQLQDYITSLTQTDPRQLNRQEQMAYWINFYNAATVNLVLSNPSKKSIRRMGKGLFSLGPWDDEVATIAAHTVTLNDVEHRILRPIWQDHRIHFVVNCASIGCPNLSKTAFSSVNLEAQLDAAEQAYINHTRGVHFDAQGRLTLSSIFDWYQSDFASSEPELLRYLAIHHTQYGKRLAEYSGKIRYAYDWDLNAARQ